MGDPKRFPIPPSAGARQCRSCKAPIYWVLTVSGRRMPVNPDGVSHFSTCPNANEHRGKGASDPMAISRVKGPRS